MGREVLALGARYRALLAMLPAFLLVGQTYLAASGIVYSLDDPYIHLALARQIWQGHYGINPGEFSAPSSSILWPFLLVPFCFTAAGELMPLAINLASLLVTLWWIGRWFETFVPSPWATLATMLAAFCFNLYGLPLNGMEHSLQVMLVVIVALSLVRERIAWPFWLSVILLPFVRYEGLAVSLPALAYLVLSPGHRLRAAIAGAVIVSAIAGSSAFLYGNGAGLLPASVMVRDAFNLPDRFSDIGRVVNNIEAQFFFVAIAAVAGVLLVRERKTAAAVLLLGAPTVGHLMFGRYGDVSRYQIYFEVWTAILFLSVYLRSGLARRLSINLLLVAGLVAGTTDAALVTLGTPMASRNIADQQKQMAIIVRDHLDEPVAVHDLGLVSLYSRRYVLDLTGLASVEALRLLADPATDVWVSALMDRRKVEHAMVYASWFARRPPNWIHVADLNLPLPCITPGSSDHVAFYSTSPQAAERLRTALAGYRGISRDREMMLVWAEPRRPSRQDACDANEFSFNNNALATAVAWARHKARTARTLFR